MRDEELIAVGELPSVIVWIRYVQTVSPERHPLSFDSKSFRVLYCSLRDQLIELFSGGFRPLGADPDVRLSRKMWAIATARDQHCQAAPALFIGHDLGQGVNQRICSG